MTPVFVGRPSSPPLTPAGWLVLSLGVLSWASAEDPTPPWQTAPSARVRPGTATTTGDAAAPTPKRDGDAAPAGTTTAPPGASPSASSAEADYPILRLASLSESAPTRAIGTVGSATQPRVAFQDGPVDGRAETLSPAMPYATPASDGGIFAAEVLGTESARGGPLSAYSAGVYDGMPSVSGGPREFLRTPYEAWSWHLLPSRPIYRSYLAGEKESRFGLDLVHDDNNETISPNTTVWNATLGARVAIVRFGTDDPLFPQGWELDVEGSAQVRLDLGDDIDVRSTDYRAGVVLARGYGRWQTKFGYYHLSSHLGDEYLLKHPGYDRLNYARDNLIYGLSYFATDELRLYGEIAYAFYTKVAKPWELQFGVEYAPLRPTGFRGAPFWAANGHLKEDNDFSGSFTGQAGWAWRGDDANHLLRVGLHVFTGKSSQYSFYHRSENQVGVGLWYDF